MYEEAPSKGHHPLCRSQTRIQSHTPPACCLVCVPQGDPVLLNKYKQSHLESYMEDNQRVVFCPSAPWCGRAIEVGSCHHVVAGSSFNLDSIDGPVVPVVARRCHDVKVSHVGWWQRCRKRKCCKVASDRFPRLC